MEEKVPFVFEYEQDERTMTEQAVVELRQAHMRWGAAQAETGSAGVPPAVARAPSPSLLPV